MYQQVEAFEKATKRKYCYRGLVPTRGDIRIEMEYSESIQHNADKQPIIGPRHHTAIEFSLPPAKSVYEIVIGS